MLSHGSTIQWINYQEFHGIIFVLQPENVGIKVVAKCRPLTSEEVDTGGNSVVTVSGDKVKVNCAGKVSGSSLVEACIIFFFLFVSTTFSQIFR